MTDRSRESALRNERLCSHPTPPETPLSPGCTGETGGFASPLRSGFAFVTVRALAVVRSQRELPARLGAPNQLRDQPRACGACLNTLSFVRSRVRPGHRPGCMLKIRPVKRKPLLALKHPYFRLLSATQDVKTGFPGARLRDSLSRAGRSTAMCAVRFT